MKKGALVFYILDLGVQLGYEFIYKDIADYFLLGFYILMAGLLCHYFRRIYWLMQKYHRFEFVKNRKSLTIYFSIFLCQLLFNFVLLMLLLDHTWTDRGQKKSDSRWNVAGLIESCLIECADGNCPRVIIQNIMRAVSGTFQLNIVFVLMAVVLNKKPDDIL